MDLPTADDLRALAQEIAAETDNDLCIPRVEDLLKKEKGIEFAQVYLHGFLSACMQDDAISEINMRAYLTVLALPDEELRYFANKLS